MSSKPRSDLGQSQLLALGQAIRAARKAHGISQEALALMSGIDRSHMGKVERGQRNVTALNLFRISESLGIKPSAILADAGL